MADQKLTALTAASSVSADDAFYVVDDPGGTPVSKKVTAANLKAYADEIRDWVSLGNLGATETVTGVDDQLYRAYGTLDQNCTITVSMSANQQVDLLVVQDGTGGRTVTFSGVDAWSGRTPSLAGRAASAVDRFYFEDVNGTTYGYWLTDDQTGISQNLVNAKGDLIVATADNTVTRLAVGATNGHVLTVDSAEATGMKWAAAAAGGDVIPVGGSTRFDVWEKLAASSGSITVAIAANEYGNCTVFKEAQNDSYSWDVYLTAGTYRVNFLYQAGAAHAIIDVVLDGSSIGTIDAYSGSTTRNNAGEFTGVVVATSGVKRITFGGATKNASSTNYRVIINGSVTFTRTA